LKLKEYYEKYKHLYKKRNFIENTFAKIKIPFGDKENTKNPNLARKCILMKLLLINFATYLAILYFLILYFSNTLSNFLSLFEKKV